MTPPVTLMIETHQGLMVPTIPDASIVPKSDNDGAAVETATRDAAARWGLPDFVLSPAVRAAGAGIREIGDGIIAVGGLSSKRRAEPGYQARSRERPIGWINP